jgi:hypothetical protein
MDECLVCTTENIFEVKGDVVWLEGTQMEETGPKKVTIARVKTVPELDITFGFCQVLRVGEGVGVVYKHFVILEHVLFAIHSICGQVFDEVVHLLPVKFVTQDSRAECVDEGMSEPGPVAQMVTAQCSAILAEGGINIANEGVHLLRVCQPAAVCKIFKLCKEIFELVSCPEKYGAYFERGDGIAASPVWGAYGLSLSE